MSADLVMGSIELRSVPAHQHLLDAGLAVVGLDDAEHRRFVAACETLLVTNGQDQLGSRDDSPSLLVTVPELFLAAPLTTADRTDINDQFALPAANAAGALQDEVARVPIEECGEGFESIEDRFRREGLAVTLSDLAFTDACGEWAGRPRVFWVRVGVMNLLVTLGGLVSALGLHLHIEDAFRPPGVQEGLYARRIRWTRNAHPDWTEDEVITEARSKTASTPRLASHKGGAAVDLRLRRADGTFLDLGHEYPDGGAVVALDAPFVTQHQWVNRHLLLVASHFAGLAMYHAEDWHVNAGDNLAVVSQQTGGVAVYGPVRSFDHQTGELVSIYDLTELDRLFPSS